MTQQRSDFFWTSMMISALAELFRQLANLSAQFLVFFRPWVMRGSRTAFARLQGLADAGLAFPPPARQMRGIQTLPAKQRTNSTGNGGGRISFFENANFVLGGKRTTLGLGHDFRISSRRGAQRSARFGCRSTTRRLTKRACAPFRGSQTPGERTTPREFPFPSRRKPGMR